MATDSSKTWKPGETCLYGDTYGDDKRRYHYLGEGAGAAASLPGGLSSAEYTPPTPEEMERGQKARELLAALSRSKGERQR
jgi:hypothetical protein